MKEIIVIGAGSCGLMAARILAEKGHHVTVLEARDRTGGRINTTHSKFSLPVELGAEFMHGKQPITRSLLKEAGHNTMLLSGKRYQLWNGELEKGDFFGDGWDELIKELKKLKRDTDMESFLNEHFAGEKYSSLRQKVQGFVEGYDAADMQRVSALALKEEWSESYDEDQYHIEGGYSALIDFLEKCLTKAGGKIFLSSPVSEIQWRAGRAKVITTTAQQFEAENVIVTVPLGVLQRGCIRFSPDIPRYEEAFKSMGFGGVVKFFFEFKDAFWEDRIPRPLTDLAFVFSDADIPTWWSQLPHKTPLLTGWLGGPPTWKLPDSPELLFDRALHSLQYILDRSRQEIENEIRHWKVVNWVHDTSSFGAYAYPTTNTQEALNFIEKPLAETVYFAGEAMYKGSAIGTVEAALHNGREVAKKIL